MRLIELDIDQILIVTFDVEVIANHSPSTIVVPIHIRNQGAVTRRIAHLNQNPAMAIDHRVAPVGAHEAGVEYEVFIAPVFGEHRKHPFPYPRLRPAREAAGQTSATELRKVCRHYRPSHMSRSWSPSSFHPRAPVDSFQARRPPTRDAAGTVTPATTSMPRQRLRCVLGMLSSLEVKVLRST